MVALYWLFLHITGTSPPVAYLHVYEHHTRDMGHIWIKSIKCFDIFWTLKLPFVDYNNNIHSTMFGAKPKLKYFFL